MSKMTRRSFVGAAAASGVAALSASIALADEAKKDEAAQADAPAEDAGEEDSKLAGPGGMSDPLDSPRELYKGWLGEAPQISDDDIVETYDADVVILGGGHAGTQCAKEAAKAGAKVAVLDQQAQDMFMFYGEDIGTFNSQYVQDMGYGPYDEQDVLA